MNPSSLFAVDDQVALATGSSRGIGRALAEGLAGAGARVVVHAWDADAVEAMVQEIRSRGRKAEGVVFDVTDEVEVQRGVARVEGEVGPIDILVNNAGIQRRGSVLDFPHPATSRRS